MLQPKPAIAAGAQFTRAAWPGTGPLSVELTRQRPASGVAPPDHNPLDPLGRPRRFYQRTTKQKARWRRIGQATHASPYAGGPSNVAFNDLEALMP